MFFAKEDGRTRADIAAMWDALQKSQAVIEFAPDGTILTANGNFLAAMGYALGEIQGRHHRLFVEPDYAESEDYAAFWAGLKRGETKSAQYKRLGKGGREVWIEASYNPIRNAAGKVVKIVKFAIDVTKQRMEFADLRGQVDAIRKSQAIIEFTLDGIVIDANQNFLDALGYSLAEIEGKHHRLFVEPDYALSQDYADFWGKLRSGEFFSGQYKRVGKGGRTVWIQASYNPILDVNGRPVKIVKYASDVTEQVELLGNLKRLIDINFSEIETAIARTRDIASATAEVTGETSENVQMVASAAEEMSASSNEISASMTKSREAASGAFQRTLGAGKATRRLAEAAASMSGITSLIQDIAGQINLLALNATIEAARAGDAGKGFAVVASEVKNLANQAAKATEQITTEIGGVQSVSDDVVGALDAIRQAIESVQEHVSATASAVEEQSAVNRDMSENMQSASNAVATIAGNVDDITAAVQQVAQSVEKTRDAASVLAR